VSSLQAMSNHADLTPNRDRAIRIEGRIDQASLERLMPQMLALVNASREPISIFIDSMGGDPEIAATIPSVLRYPTDGMGCRIISVGCRRVGSAATHILAAGDLAIVHPQCQLLYHGSGYNEAPGRLTAELTGELANATNLHDERLAASFARNCLRRGIAVISALRAEFSEHRLSDPHLTDIECFQKSLIARLSPAGKRTLRRARGIASRSDALISCFQSEIASHRPMGIVAIERAALNASVAFEYTRANRLLSAGGLPRINEHFFFLKQFVGEERGEKLADVAGESATDEVLPFLPFLLSLYRALGKGENRLTPPDALWLGLIDTIREDCPL
jgi:Clp protease